MQPSGAGSLAMAAIIAHPPWSAGSQPDSVECSMEFRRITNLPPYVFTIINNLKIEARRAGADVIDLGFGNPDIPSPQIAVDKLAEAAHNAAQPPLLDQPRPAQAARGDRRLLPAQRGASSSIPSWRSPTRSARRRASAT